MAEINNLQVIDSETGEAVTYEITDPLHDEMNTLINHDPVIELKNSIVDYDETGYNAETLSETLNSGTENNIYTRYLAKKQVTGIEANAAGNGLEVTTVNQSGAVQTQEIELTGLDTDALTTRVSANETSISSLNTRVTNLQSAQTSQASDITSLQSEQTEQAGDIATLQTDVSTAQSDITELQSKVSTHNTAIADQAEEIATANGKINTNTNGIASLEELTALLSTTGAGFHNSIYRGKSLGTTVTDDQWAAIKDGTFTDLYIGDYWTINEIVWRIAAFDYYINTGDTLCTNHHAVIIPDTAISNSVLYDTDTTSGAYVGSVLYTSNIQTAKDAITNAFTSSHILSHRNYLKNAAANGYETSGLWYDSTAELMTEQNIYGGKIFANSIAGTNVAAQFTIDKTQYPLFKLDNSSININTGYWLRDVSSNAHFAYVSADGLANSGYVTVERGVRPAFCIYSSN